MALNAVENARIDAQLPPLGFEAVAPAVIRRNARVDDSQRTNPLCNSVRNDPGRMSPSAAFTASEEQWSLFLPSDEI